MTSAFSWQNSISLCPASFCISRPNLPITPGVILTSYFCISVPYNEKDTFWGVLVLEGLGGLHRTVQLQLLQHTGQGIDLDYCDFEWFALVINQGDSFIFEIAPKYCILDFFFFFSTMRATPFLLRDSFPQ